MKTDKRPAEADAYLFTHCRQCLECMPAGESPRSWARLQVGMTEVGIQVWCVRHEINVMHIDFMSDSAVKVDATIYGDFSTNA